MLHNIPLPPNTCIENGNICSYIAGLLGEKNKMQSVLGGGGTTQAKPHSISFSNSHITFRKF